MFKLSSFRHLIYICLVILVACAPPDLVEPTPLSEASPEQILTVQVTDLPNGYTPSIVVQWNEAALSAVRWGPSRPTVITRSMFMLHTAMYDAWAAYDDIAQPVYLVAGLRRFPEQRTYENKQEAAAQAAYQALIHLYPDYEHDTQAFSSLLAVQGFSPISSADISAGAQLSPAAIGLLAAQATINARQFDGSNQKNDFADITSQTYPELFTPVNDLGENLLGSSKFDAGHWQPLRVPTGQTIDDKGNPIVVPDDPTSYSDQSFLTPHWGAVLPFALTSGGQLRPPAPPIAGSDEPYQDSQGNKGTNDEIFKIQLAEVLALSANLSDQDKVMAEYWADGPRSETPPGHWNALAHGVSERDYHSIDKDIKFYFALNCALFDAGISAWESKRYYDYIRPISAIQHFYAGQMIEAWAGPGEGTQLIPAEAWRPYQQSDFVTPPFPEYVSGHSAFSAAAAEVIATFTGSDRYYDDGETILHHSDFNSDGVPDVLGQHIVPVHGNQFEPSPAEVVILRWDTFSAAADEAGLSRLYGGIHFAEADFNGRKIGRASGAQAYKLAETYWMGKN